MKGGACSQSNADKGRFKLSSGIRLLQNYADMTIHEYVAARIHTVVAGRRKIHDLQIKLRNCEIYYTTKPLSTWRGVLIVRFSWSDSGESLSIAR